jgi:pimeloyl-ACP methyl ester carboxylesterase
LRKPAGLPFLPSGSNAMKSKSTRPPPANKSAKTAPADELRGASRALVDAVEGVTNIVEQMHGTILRAAPVVGPETKGRTRGITGLVYRNVRGVTRVAGDVLDAAFATLTPLVTRALAARAPQPNQAAYVETLRAVLNGVAGDYLAQTNNPLAIPMQLRQHGQQLDLAPQSLAAQFSHDTGRLVVLIHGLCMNDLLWRREGHDHGTALAADLGVTPLYLHYNTGLPIAENGRACAAQMTRLVSAWPVPIQEIVFVCHSMGGLVARSACAVAQAENLPWLPHLKKIIFLGTPHDGARLERAGKWIDKALMVSPYSAPFAKLGKVRSAGINDLGHGRWLDDETMKAAPLPEGIVCHAIAATTAHEPAEVKVSLPGDGLVQVASALGRYRDAAHAQPMRHVRRKIFYHTNHFALLSSAEVYRYLRRVVGGRNRRDARSA